jgi:hypothetical protein
MMASVMSARTREEVTQSGEDPSGQEDGSRQAPQEACWTPNGTRSRALPFNAQLADPSRGSGIILYPLPSIDKLNGARLSNSELGMKREMD